MLLNVVHDYPNHALRRRQSIGLRHIEQSGNDVAHDVVVACDGQL
jgi:hypothetical protein